MTDLIKQIEGFEPELNISDIGTVLEAGDGIARVQGLANVRAQELVQYGWAQRPRPPSSPSQAHHG